MDNKFEAILSEIITKKMFQQLQTQDQKLTKYKMHGRRGPKQSLLEFTHLTMRIQILKTTIFLSELQK